MVTFYLSFLEKIEEKQKIKRAWQCKKVYF